MTNSQFLKIIKNHEILFKKSDFNKEMLYIIFNVKITCYPALASILVNSRRQSMTTTRS